MRIVLSSLTVILVISGCGYKGPLVLPKPKPAAQQPVPAAPGQPDASKSGEGTAKE